jgi:hypothetical protein
MRGDAKDREQGATDGRKTPKTENTERPMAEKHRWQRTRSDQMQMTPKTEKADQMRKTPQAMNATE